MSLTDEELVKIKQAVLTATRKDLVRNIDPRRHFTYLRSKLVLDERDCDEIRSTTSRIGAAELFVDILIRKGGTGYDEFRDALLYEKTQIFLLEKLDKTFEVLKSKVKEQKALKSAKQQQQQQQQHHRPHGYPQNFPVPLHQPDRHGMPNQLQPELQGSQPPACNPVKPFHKMHPRHTPVEGPDFPPHLPPYQMAQHEMYPPHFMLPVPHALHPHSHTLPASWDPLLYQPHAQPPPNHVPPPELMQPHRPPGAFLSNTLASRDPDSDRSPKTEAKTPVHKDEKIDEGPCGADSHQDAARNA